MYKIGLILVIIFFCSCGSKDNHKYDGSYDTNYPTFHYESGFIQQKSGYRRKMNILVEDTSEEEYHFWQNHK